MDEFLYCLEADKVSAVFGPKDAKTYADCPVIFLGPHNFKIGDKIKRDRKAA